LSRWAGNSNVIAKSGDLFTAVRKQGLRKKAVRAVAEAHGGKRCTAAAQEVLADLEKATDTIRRHVTTPDARPRAAKKAAATRRRRRRRAATRRGARKRTTTSR
jgi:hypothetical protein